MKKRCFIFFIVFFIFNFYFFSCSSQPKNAGEINNLRKQVEAGLITANREAAMGRFSSALSLLTEHKRNAILADDPSLIIRVSLSRGNILFSLGRISEAYTEWDEAVAEAVRFGNDELLSVARIFYARGNLLSGRVSAESTLDIVNRESLNIKKDRLYIAFASQVKGFTLRTLGRWNEAEIEIRKSLDIHQKDRHLENASYDWYIIASIRSLSGNFTGALEALDSSIALDRRIENSWGLAASWRAMGDVYVRAGRNTDAKESYLRSRAIYDAMRHDQEVIELDIKIKELSN
ncbi:MAG: tetratricopeptide repeat protein [Treponema sp.]|nr:tetratricopeptide repeat protein [Treponema sp.]